MKLITWNVNGLRACMNKGFADFMQQADADIFCIQETKMQREQSTFEFPGYHEYWNSAVKKGYSGTAIFTKEEPENVTYGLGIEEHDQEGRVITAEYPGFILVNVYTPNSQRGLVRLDYRGKMGGCLPGLCEPAGGEKAGDRVRGPERGRTAHRPEEPGQQSQERRVQRSGTGQVPTVPAARVRGFLPQPVSGSGRGLHLVVLYVQGTERNAGWRIDYFLVSENGKDHIEDVVIHNEVFGSDHCPVELDWKE
jgi:exodeoxyribonuclease III